MAVDGLVDEAMEALRRFENDSRVAGYIASGHPEIVLEAVRSLEQRNQQWPTPVCRGDRMCMAKDHDENCVWFKW